MPREPLSGQMSRDEFLSTIADSYISLSDTFQNNIPALFENNVSCIVSIHIVHFFEIMDVYEDVSVSFFEVRGIFL